MSFHSFLRKLGCGAGGDEYAALEDVSCKIRAGCTTHKPWDELFKDRSSGKTDSK